MKISKFTLYILLLLGFNACQKWDKVEPIPGYIYISSFNLSTNYITHGTSSSKITDVWCYSNGKLLGVFELPATIPILPKDSGEITLRPGIFRDGLSATRTEYIFYNPYKENRKIISGNVDTINPTITYSDGTTFVWREDFESLGATFRKADVSDTTFTLITDSNKLEGNASLGFFLDEKRKFGRIETLESFALDNTGRQIYLEMNFKTDDRFVVAIQAESAFAGTTLLNRFVSNPTANTWRKVYLHLTPVIQQAYPDSKFRIVIYASKSDDKTGSYYFFDNFKIVQ